MSAPDRSPPGNDADSNSLVAPHAVWPSRSVDSVLRYESTSHALISAMSWGIGTGWAYASLVGVVATVASGPIQKNLPAQAIPLVFALAAWTICAPLAVALGAVLAAVIRWGCRRHDWLTEARVDSLPAHAATAGALLSPLNFPAWLGVMVLSELGAARPFVVAFGAMALPLAGMAAGFHFGLRLRRRCFPDRTPRIPTEFALVHLVLIVVACALTFWGAGAIARSKSGSLFDF